MAQSQQELDRFLYRIWGSDGFKGFKEDNVLRQGDLSVPYDGGMFCSELRLPPSCINIDSSAFYHGRITEKMVLVDVPVLSTANELFYFMHSSSCRSCFCALGIRVCLGVYYLLCCRC